MLICGIVETMSLRVTSYRWKKFVVQIKTEFVLAKTMPPWNVAEQEVIFYDLMDKIMKSRTDSHHWT